MDMSNTNTSPLSSTAAAINDGISLDSFRGRLNIFISPESTQQQLVETELRHAHERLRQKAAARLRDSVSLQNTVEHALEKRVETLFAGMSKSNKNEDDEKDDASLYGKLMKRTDLALIEREATYAPIKKCVERAYELWGRAVLSVLLFMVSLTPRRINVQRGEERGEYGYADEHTHDEMQNNDIDGGGEFLQNDREE